MAKARIAVVGAGLMGHGIAQVFALAGHDVTIYDSIVASLDTVKTRILTNLKDLGDDQKAVERVTPVSDLAQAVCDADYVVEAVLEDLPLKQKLFAEISCVRSGDLASVSAHLSPRTWRDSAGRALERTGGTAAPVPLVTVWFVLDEPAGD
jgi:3-hydroxybutyryl-CoA dehydrogenase